MQDLLDREAEDRQSDALNPGAKAEVDRLNKDFAVPSIKDEDRNTRSGGFAPTLVNGSVASSSATRGISELVASRAADRLKGIFSAINLKSRKNIAGILITTVLGGGGLLGLMVEGPGAVLIHAGQLLSHQSANQEEDESTAIGRFTRYYRAITKNDFAETRVGKIGSLRYGKAIAQLEAKGITIERGPLGRPIGYTYDKAGACQTAPAVCAMSDEEYKEHVSRQIKQPAEKLSVRNGKVSIDISKLPFAERATFTKTNLQALGDGKVSTFMKYRNLRKTFGLGSVFHPLSRAVQQKIDEKVTAATEKGKAKGEATTEAKAAVAEDSANARKAPVQAKATDAKLKVENEKGKAGLKVAGLAGGGLAAICIIHNTAESVVTINRDTVELPAAIEATNLISLGAQLQFNEGKDITQDQVGTAYDSASKLFRSTAMQSLNGTGKAGAKNDLPPKYAVAFSDSTTFSGIGKYTDKALKGQAGTLCNQWVQLGIAGGTLLAVGVYATFTAPETGGASLALLSGGAAVLEGAITGFVAGEVIGGITKSVVDSNTIDSVPQKVFNSPIGGTLVASGARVASNLNAIGSGGILLGNNTSTKVSQVRIDEEKQQFVSKGFFARMFDITDYRSLTGRLADDMSPGIVSTIGSGMTSMTHLGSTLSGMFSRLLPKAQAEGGTPSYSGDFNWGFGQYGIPDFIMNAPQFENPYATSSNAAAYFETSEGQADIVRAKICFGQVVGRSPDDNVWDTVPTGEDVDPHTADYENANCNPFKNNKVKDAPNWALTMMFIFYTMNAKTVDCFDGATEETAASAQSCQDLGVTDSDDISAATSGGGAKFRLSSFNICYGVATDNDSGLSACAAGKDYRSRLANSVKFIKDNTLDVVGLQEVRGPATPAGDQWTAIQSSLPNYDIFPTDFQNYPGQNSIIWDNTKFSLVKGKKIPGYTVTAGPDPVAYSQVRLRTNDSAGQEFYVINVHEPVGNTKQVQTWRRDAAKQLADYTKQLSAEGIPIFLTGDMNSKYSATEGNQTALDGEIANQPYCILIGEGILQDSLDVSKGSTGKCPSNLNGGVDHIYMSTGVQATNFTYKGAGVNDNGSDHNTLFVDVTIPGSEATGNAAVPYKNPVYDGNVPDPTVIKADDGTYHLYTTGVGLQHLTSTDLVHWKRATGNVLSGAPAAATGYTWAPDVQKTGDHYTITWAGAPPGNQTFSIFYGVSSSAGGPFKYKGRLIPPGYLGTYSLDPNIYMSDQGPILYYGSGGKGITAVKLTINEDDTITPGKETVLFPANPATGPNAEWTAEGAWMQKHGDYYYMYYSVGRYDFTNPNVPAYQVHVARSKSPLGPFEKDPTPVLQGKEGALRPGHNSIALDNAGNEWMIYHAYVGSDKSNRKLMLDPITYQPNGWPIVNDGYPSITQQANGPATGAATNTSGDALAGGIAWPVPKKYWDTDRADFLQGHPTYSGTFTSPYVKGVADDIGDPPNGTPVYSMLDGVVEKTNICGQGDGMIIKSAVAGGTLHIAYGHGIKPRFNIGDTVKAGQQILDLDGVGCQVSGGHVHIDMAIGGASYADNSNKHICPQDVFLAMGANQTPDFLGLTSKAQSDCGRL